MKDPVTFLMKLIKDPIEFTSITLPSAALVAILFTYKTDIHEVFSKVPDLTSGNVYGGLIFIALTLTVSSVLKTVSHDVLNWIYDKLYRDRKRTLKETWYKRCEESNFLTTDNLQSQYQEAYDELKIENSPLVPKIDLLQIQSKFARSMSFFLILFALAICFWSNVIIGLACMFLSFIMLFSFLKGRWEASELVYKSIYEKRTDVI